MLILRKSINILKRKLEMISSIFFYNRTIYSLSLFMFFLFFICLFGCKKQDESINYSPTGDNLNVDYTDTTTVFSYTLKEDSIITYNTSMASSTSSFLAGNYMDPVFGYSSASIYAQLALSSTNIDFGSNLHLDSVVLSLKYAGYYGIDTNSLYSINIYELTDDLKVDSSYYSNSNHLYDNVALGSKSFIPDFNSSVILKSGDTLSPQLRIRLNDSFGQRLLDLSGQSPFVDDDAFLEYFKGVLISFSNIATSSDKGLIYYFNLLDENSKLTLYYSNIDNDSLSFSFPFSSNHVIHSSFSHDYTGTEVETSLLDTTSGENKIYVQAMSGTKAAISFPYIKDWSQNNSVAINKAELIITPDSDSYNTYLPNPQLSLLLDSLGSLSNVPDESFTNGYEFDGAYDETTNTYTFNISLYFEDVISGKTSADYPLYLVSTNGYENAFRSALNGYLNTTSGIKLKLTYTKL